MLDTHHELVQSKQRLQRANQQLAHIRLQARTLEQRGTADWETSVAPLNREAAGIEGDISYLQATVARLAADATAQINARSVEIQTIETQIRTLRNQATALTKAKPEGWMAEVASIGPQIVVLTTEASRLQTEISNLESALSLGS